MKRSRNIFFGFLVAAYFVTSLGLPVYLHYCAGQLEEVSYYVESDSCCGEDEPEDDCCKSEDLYLINLSDVISKSAETLQPPAPDAHADLLFTLNPFETERPARLSPHPGGLPPPRLQHSLLISSTILRI